MYSFPNLEPVCCSMSCSNCCFLTCIQTSTVWITTKCEKFLKRWEYQTTYLPPYLQEETSPIQSNYRLRQNDLMLYIRYLESIILLDTVLESK